MSLGRPVAGSVRSWDATVRSGLARFLLRSRNMARGFESKSVESQQEEAQRAKSTRQPMTPEEQARATRKTGLELALAQRQAEMTAACRPAHREMLKLRLQAIREEIEGL